eukprot:5119735-Pleurochrysis_carterae.AAC.2
MNVSFKYDRPQLRVQHFDRTRRRARPISTSSPLALLPRILAFASEKLKQAAGQQCNKKHCTG